MAKSKKAQVSPASAAALSEQLSTAILRGDLNGVKELVQRGVALNKPLKKGEFPPLHYAITLRKLDIARHLIQAGADVNLKAKDQYEKTRTPLIMAAKHDQLDVLQALLAAGADLHFADELGWTALDTAAKSTASTAGLMVEALIGAGADVNRFSKTWGSPLIKACWQGHPSATRALVAHGADVDVMTASATPLLQAIDNKRADVVGMLLAAGADPNLRYVWPLGGNKEFLGKTPLELAQQRKLKKILPLLENSQGGSAPLTSAEPTAAEVPGLWKQLEKVLGKAAPDLKKLLAKPATARQLSDVVKLTGLPLPDDFKASYLIHNGQKQGMDLYEPEDSLDGPYFLMPLKEIVDEWKMWKTLVDGGEFRGRESTPDEGIRQDWWHPGWIPFMSNGGGDSLCVDLAPTGKGVPGQVIQMIHDSPKRRVLAHSLAGFLSMLIEQWEQRSEE